MQALFLAPASSSDDFVVGLQSLLNQLISNHHFLSDLELDPEDVALSRGAPPAELQTAVEAAMRGVRESAERIDSELGITARTPLGDDVFGLATIIRREEWQQLYFDLMAEISAHTSATEAYLLRRLFEAALVEPPIPG